MKKYLCALVVALFSLAPGAAAFTVRLSLVPSSLAVSPGVSIAVDVNISGLVPGGPPSVGAFDLDVGFDRALLAPVDVAFGPFLGNPSLFEALTDFSFATPGIVDFAEVSLLASSELDALQPSAFRLATLSFVGIGTGFTRLAFSGDQRVDDAFGNKFNVLLAEPGTLLLIGLALALVGAGRSRAVRGSHPPITPPAPLHAALALASSVRICRRPPPGW